MDTNTTYLHTLDSSSIKSVLRDINNSLTNMGETNNSISTQINGTTSSYSALDQEEGESGSSSFVMRKKKKTICKPNSQIQRKKSINTGNLDLQSRLGSIDLQGSVSSPNENSDEQLQMDRIPSKKVRFTAEEDEQLRCFISQHGKRWSFISELMGGQSETRIRNRYYSHIRNIPGFTISSSSFAKHDRENLPPILNENNFNESNSYQISTDINMQQTYQEQPMNAIDSQNVGKQINSETEKPLANGQIWEENFFGSMNMLDKMEGQNAENRTTHGLYCKGEHPDGLLISSYNQLPFGYPSSCNNLGFENNQVRHSTIKHMHNPNESLNNLDLLDKFNDNYLQSNYCERNRILNSIQDIDRIEEEMLFNQRNGSSATTPKVAGSGSQNLNWLYTNSFSQKSNSFLQDNQSPILPVRVKNIIDPYNYDEIQEEVYNHQNSIQFPSFQELHSYSTLSDQEKMEKMHFLNTQIVHISSMLNQCKNEIAKEIFLKSQQQSCL